MRENTVRKYVRVLADKQLVTVEGSFVTPLLCLARDRLRDYFPMPNEIFSLCLTPKAVAVYAYLMRREDHKTYRCHPSCRVIAETLGMSRNTVMKCVAELEEKHLIRTERTTIFSRKGLKRNGSLLYTILPIQTALDYRYEQQCAENERRIERKRVQRALEKQRRASVKYVEAVKAIAPDDAVLPF